MNYVDQHYNHRTTSGSLKRGNLPLRRLWESKTVNSTCNPKAGLPKNIYSADLTQDAVETLQPLQPIKLPNVRQQFLVESLFSHNLYETRTGSYTTIIRQPACKRCP